MRSSNRRSSEILRRRRCVSGGGFLATERLPPLSASCSAVARATSCNRPASCLCGRPSKKSGNAFGRFRCGAARGGKRVSNQRIFDLGRQMRTLSEPPRWERRGQALNVRIVTRAVLQHAVLAFFRAESGRYRPMMVRISSLVISRPSRRKDRCGLYRISVRRQTPPSFRHRSLNCCR